MQRICANPWCHQLFEVTSNDLAFYEKVSPVFPSTALGASNGKKELIDPPTLCHRCRMQRRFAHRNEQHLYRRTCSLSGRSLITVYPATTPFPVYDKESWWSDAWDPLHYGKPFDPSASFFDQWQALRLTVPRLGTIDTNDEGSAYCVYCASVKNCYMCTSVVGSEHIFYSYQTNASRDCIDCYRLTQGEGCYECIHSFGLHDCQHCRDCENSSGLLFCDDCRGCHDCIGCKNLVNKRYWISNSERTKEEYKALRQGLGGFRERQQFASAFRAFAQELPTRAAHLIQCENASGDHLHSCRNTLDSFDAVNLEDCRFVGPIPEGAHDVYDSHYCPKTELLLECLSAVRASRCRFCLYAWDDDDLLYCDECFSCKNCFGCVGLRHKQYCILNVQYSRETYEELAMRMIDHMRNAQQWSEFLPIRYSLTAYNTSMAMDEFAVTKEEAASRLWPWREAEEELLQFPATCIAAADLPDHMDALAADMQDLAVLCQESNRPFRIIKQEITFYRTHQIPLPCFHPSVRFNHRSLLRNPRTLFARNCSKCGAAIWTTYPVERPEKVMCEECYLKEVC